MTIAKIPVTMASLSDPTICNPLPTLIHTPSGLALVEIQGTINLPSHHDIESNPNTGLKLQQTYIGYLEFPDYDTGDSISSAWMKRVYLYVGKHQRLTGEVKKLPKAIAVLQKKDNIKSVDDSLEGHHELDIGLEIVEIVKFKILFSTRPEPVGTTWEG